MTRPTRTRLKFDQTADAPVKVKQGTAGPDKVNQEAFCPDKIEQGSAGGPPPVVEGYQTGISVWGHNIFDVV